MSQNKAEKGISSVKISVDDEVIDVVEKKEDGSGIELIDEKENNETDKSDFNEKSIEDKDSKDEEDSDFSDEDEEKSTEFEEEEETEDESDDYDEVEDTDKEGIEKPEKNKKKLKKQKKEKGKNKKIMIIGIIVAFIIIFAFVGTDSFKSSNENGNFSVKVKDRKIGDSVKYSISGDLYVSNQKGLMERKIGTVTVKITDVDVNLKGNAGTEFVGVTEAKNGFQNPHKCLKTSLFQKIDFDGIAHTDNPLKDEVEINGDIDTFETLLVDLNTNLTIQSVTKSYINISADTGDSSKSRDKIYSYPQLKEQKDFDFNEIYLNRTFEKGDKGEEQVSDSTISWEVTQIEKINGVKSIKIHITIDKATMNNQNIESFYSNIWISNDFSLPVKIEINAKGKNGDNNYELSYIAEFNDFEKGEDKIPYNSCSYSVDQNQHFENMHKDSEIEQFNDYIPSQGDINKPFSPNFNATQAIETGKKSNDFKDFLENNPNSYVVYGFYNETDNDKGIWNLSFGTKGGTKGYFINVSENKILNEGEISFSELDLIIENSKSEIGSFLTFSSSENIFYQEEKIRSEMEKGFDGLNFGVQTNLKSPEFDLNSLFFEATKIKYAYFLEKDDDSFRTAMDAENGRLIFIWHHEGDSLSFI